LLYGNSILGTSGMDFGVPNKGARPLMIKYNSIPLALVPETDDVAEQLVAVSEQTVQLTGIVRCEPIKGRAPRGQQGYTGLIPFHDLYYLVVSSCTVLPEKGNGVNIE
jgi:hypothetical protein